MDRPKVSVLKLVALRNDYAGPPHGILAIPFSMWSRNNAMRASFFGHRDDTGAKAPDGFDWFCAFWRHGIAAAGSRL